MAEFPSFERPSYDELVREVAELREKVDQKLRVGDLPIEALKRRLESDWLPQADTFLLPKSVGPDSLEPPEAGHFVGAVGEPTFQNGASSHAAQQVAFYKDPWGRVHLKGVVLGAGISVTFFTLPSGYRPPHVVRFKAVTHDPGVAWGHSIIAVGSNGNVEQNDGPSGSTVERYLDGISFRAA